MANEYSLYTHPQLVAEITEIFENNQRVKRDFKEAYNKLIEGHSDGFKFSWDIDNAISRAFYLMDAVEELSESLPEIQSKNFKVLLVERFKELGKEARELYFYHRKSFHGIEESENDLGKIFPKEKADFIYKHFYAKLSDFIHYTENLYSLGESLEKHSKLQSLTTQLKDGNNFWITEEGGQYFFDKTPVGIKSKSAHYARIFEAVFMLKPEGGEITYSDVSDECARRGLKRITPKKVQRALSGNTANFFKHVKNIKQSPRRGILIFEATPDGKYIKFNNRKT